MKIIAVAIPLSLAFYITGLTGSSAEDRCRVMDPTGTPLNVRTSPNGNIVGNLRNGVLVSVLDRSDNVGRRSWVYVGRDGVPIGWVYRDYIDCKVEAVIRKSPSPPGEYKRWDEVFAPKFTKPLPPGYFDFIALAPDVQQCTAARF